MIITQAVYEGIINGVPYTRLREGNVHRISPEQKELGKLEETINTLKKTEHMSEEIRKTRHELILIRDYLYNPYEKKQIITLKKADHLLLAQQDKEYVFIFNLNEDTYKENTLTTHQERGFIYNIPIIAKTKLHDGKGYGGVAHIKNNMSGFFYRPLIIVGGAEYVGYIAAVKIKDNGKKTMLGYLEAIL